MSQPPQPTRIPPRPEPAAPPAEPVPITHPVWCDPTRCTAPAEQPTRETYQGERERGEHLSAEVENLWGATAYLSQAVAPWECRVHLRIEANGVPGRLSFELGAGDPLLMLLGQQVAEQQRRWPRLMAALSGGEETGA